MWWLSRDIEDGVFLDTVLTSVVAESRQPAW
jgi:hypothetical protein